MRVFIDGGGNSVSGIRRYLSNFSPFDKIFVFEPNPLFFKDYEDDKFNFLNKAIWIEDVTMPFYLSKDINQVASSLLQKEKECILPNKKFSFYEEPIIVECIDFSKWLEDSIKDDYVVLKLDIEGAEYEVLRKMVSDETINKVDELYVEFHKEHLKIPEKDHFDLLNTLKQRGIKIKDWD